MPKRYFYFLAVIFVIVARVLILNTHFPEWLQSHGAPGLAHVLLALRTNAHFLYFVGGWMMPVFIFAVVVYWLTEEEEDRIPRQFWFLPLAYLPLSVTAFTMLNSEFTFSALYRHPFIVLPYGYVYVAFWAALIWLLGKLRVAR